VLLLSAARGRRPPLSIVPGRSNFSAPPRSAATSLVDHGRGPPCTSRVAVQGGPHVAPGRCSFDPAKPNRGRPRRRNASPRTALGGATLFCRGFTVRPGPTAQLPRFSRKNPPPLPPPCHPRAPPALSANHADITLPPIGPFVLVARFPPPSGGPPGNFGPPPPGGPPPPSRKKKKQPAEPPPPFFFFLFFFFFPPPPRKRGGLVSPPPPPLGRKELLGDISPSIRLPPPSNRFFRGPPPPRFTPLCCPLVMPPPALLPFFFAPLQSSTGPPLAPRVSLSFGVPSASRVDGPSARSYALPAFLRCLCHPAVAHVRPPAPASRPSHAPKVLERRSSGATVEVVWSRDPGGGEKRKGGFFEKKHPAPLLGPPPAGIGPTPPRGFQTSPSLPSPSFAILHKAVLPLPSRNAFPPSPFFRLNSLSFPRPLWSSNRGSCGRPSLGFIL